jgi:hypothetical protein
MVAGVCIAFALLNEDANAPKDAERPITGPPSRTTSVGRGVL